MVEISLVSNIHFPGKWHRPHLPANPGELPYNFQVSAERYGPLSRCCHSPLKLHLVKSRAVQEKEKNSPPSPPQRKPATTLVFPRLSYQGAWRGAWRPGEISHPRIQDDDNFQHDQKCNWRNGCFAIQKLSHSLTGLYPCFQ